MHLDVHTQMNLFAHTDRDIYRERLGLKCCRNVSKYENSIQNERILCSVIDLFLNTFQKRFAEYGTRGSTGTWIPCDVAQKKVTHFIEDYSNVKVKNFIVY